ncbi:hypothetical protein BDR26DRAFT_31223 [Obelidium mucronatum]|nr:hypothetical protein BDR26DRAFT_31223 [Obelidium mucronatum]
MRFAHTAATPATLALLIRTTLAFSGQLTYYEPAGGFGSCGNTLQNGDHVVAIGPAQYDLGKCGQTICVTNGQRSAEAVIADRCAGCAFGDIDVTIPIFTTFADLGAGRISISWSFGACGGSAPAQAPPPPPPAAAPCVPTTSCSQSQCGTTIQDNCGTQLTCPACPCASTTTCNSNQCGTTIKDNCGNNLSCPACPACVPNGIQCTREQCGTVIKDNCGRDVICPACPCASTTVCTEAQCGTIIKDNCGRDLGCPACACVSSSTCRADQCGTVVKDNCGKDLVCPVCTVALSASAVVSVAAGGTSPVVTIREETLSNTQSLATVTDTATTNVASTTKGSSAAVQTTEPKSSAVFAIPLNSVVVWPSVVNATRPLSQRNRCRIP